MTQQADITTATHTAPAAVPGAVPAAETETIRTAGAPPGPPAPGYAVRPLPHGAATLPFAPAAPPAGYVPTPPPVPPLNTLSWVSVVAAVVAAPIGIVTGLLAERRIRRTGERGRTLALIGTTLGSLLTVAGIAAAIVVLAVVGPVSEAVAPASTPAPVASAPSSPASSPASPSSPASAPRAGAPTRPGAPAGPAAPAAPAAGQGAAAARGKAAIVQAFTELDQASAAELPKLQRDGDAGDLAALQADFREYRSAVTTFRADLQSAPLTDAQRTMVDQRILPTTDRVISDLQTLSTAHGSSALSRAAQSLQTDLDELAAQGEAAVR